MLHTCDAAQRGQGLVEYVLILAFAVLVTAGALALIAGPVGSIIATAAAAL